MSQKYTLLYEKIIKSFILSSLYLITFLYILGICLYQRVYPYDYLVLAGGVAHIIFLIVVHIVPLVYIKKLVIIYCNVLIIVLHPIAVIDFSMNNFLAFWGYFCLPVCIYIIFPDKRTVYYSGGCLILIILATIIAMHLRHNDPNFLTSERNLLLNMFSPFIRDIIIYLLNICVPFLLICNAIYYLHRIRRIPADRLLDKTDDEDIDDRTVYLPELVKNKAIKQEKIKYEKIYDDIVQYFEVKKPYLNADFKLVQLASELDININYLSKAIRIKKDMNFNRLVNFYRIENVKKLIQNDSYRYTLQHIYLSSGFKSQSVFNHAFKEQEGITPSDYINKIKTKN